MEKCAQERYLAMREEMFPRDTNGRGRIFGGVILAYIDVAGAMAAKRKCTNDGVSSLVTRAMDRVEFKIPVLVNDIVTLYGTVTRIGTTSITVHVEIEADRRGNVFDVTEAYVTYVAVDEAGDPVPVLAPSPDAVTGDSSSVDQDCGCDAGADSPDNT